jgi:hypothetical protein
MNVVVLLVLAWAGFVAYIVTRVLPQRRDSRSHLPGLSALPEKRVIASRAAAYHGRPVVARRRGIAARRRLNTLLSLFASTLLIFVVALVTSHRAVWAAFAVSGTLTTLFIVALYQRTQVRRAQYVERLWEKGRHDELGHNKVMSLEEARHRAEQIADPVFVPASYGRQRRIS